MASEVIIALIGVLSTVITFFLTKRKYNTEVDSQQIKNMSDSLDVYKKIMEEALASQKRLMEATITFQNQTIESQNKRIEELQKENVMLRKQVSELQMQMINFANKYGVPAIPPLNQ